MFFKEPSDFSINIRKQNIHDTIHLFSIDLKKLIKNLK
jgi:hypothetical protein